MITPVKYDKHGSSIELTRLMTKGNMDDQINIKFIKQEEFNANIVKRLEELEDFKSQTIVRQDKLKSMIAQLFQDIENNTNKANIRFDQGIENRTKAFERIQELETQVEALQAFNYNTDIKLERIDDILVVHRNQSDSQRKNHANLIKVWDEKVIPLIEGTHGKEVPRKTDAEQAIINLNKTLFGKETNGKQK